MEATVPEELALSDVVSQSSLAPIVPLLSPLVVDAVEFEPAVQVPANGPKSPFEFSVCAVQSDCQPETWTTMGVVTTVSDVDQASEPLPRRVPRDWRTSRLRNAVHTRRATPGRMTHLLQETKFALQIPEWWTTSCCSKTERPEPEWKPRRSPRTRSTAVGLPTIPGAEPENSTVGGDVPSTRGIGLTPLRIKRVQRRNGWSTFKSSASDRKIHRGPLGVWHHDVTTSLPHCDTIPDKMRNTSQRTRTSITG